MSIAPAGPAYGNGNCVWTTRCELEFVEGLGHWRSPEWLPADSDSPRAYRVMLLRNYLAAMERRRMRGNVNWQEVRAAAVRLLREA